MSQLHSVLGSLVLGYAPVMDKQRQVLATRLTLAPLRPDLAVDGQAVLDASTSAAAGGDGFDDGEDDTVVLEGVGFESKTMLWPKSKRAWTYVHHHFGKHFDWFLKADDDTCELTANFFLFPSVFSPSGALPLFAAHGRVWGPAGSCKRKRSPWV